MAEKRTVISSPFRGRRSGGFTLVELLVVVIIIGILSAIAIPNFTASQGKARNASVRLNMRTTQVASESFATDSGGIYGASVNQIINYFPGGNNTANGTPGVFPPNPVTGVSNESPLTGGPVTTAALVSERTMVPAGFLTKGRTSYDQVDAGTSYSVMGSDSEGNHLSGPTGNRLVLSNQ